MCTVLFETVGIYFAVSLLGTNFLIYFYFTFIATHFCPAVWDLWFCPMTGWFWGIACVITADSGYQYNLTLGSWLHSYSCYVL
jgi:hypothetical protein